MKQIIIVGTGSFAELMFQYLQENENIEVVAFSVNRQYIGENNSTMLGLPVIALEELNKRYDPRQCSVIIAVGYSKMNHVRNQLFTECKQMGFSVASYIHPTALIARGTKLGEGNIFLERSLVQPYVTIGDGNLFWYDVKIAHNGVIGDFNTFTGNTNICGFVNIDDYCFFGNSSIVSDHLSIAEHTLVGLGAIIKANTKPYDVILPARSVTLEGRKSIEFI